MPHYVAFHLGVHCLPKYPSRGFWPSKGMIRYFTTSNRLKIIFVVANSVNPDELLLHGLPKKAFRNH